MKRVCKEYPIEDKLFNNIYGTVNKNEPKVLYLKSKIKIYIEDKNNYINDMIILKEEFNKMLKKYLKENASLFPEHIIYIDCSEASLNIKKTTYFKYDLYIKPRDIKPIEKQIDLIKTIFSTTNNILLDLLKKYKLKTI